MKHIPILIATTLLLTCCKKEDNLQTEIETLSNKLNQCETKAKEIQTKFDSAQTAIKEINKENTILKDSLKEMEIQTKLLTISVDQRLDDNSIHHLFRDGYPGDLTQLFFCGDKSGVLNAIMKESDNKIINNYGILPLSDRFKYVRGEKISPLYDKSDSTGKSNNHERNTPEFIFEYLGDCLGNNLAFGFQDNYSSVNTILNNFPGTQIENLVDFVSERTVIVLENEWKTPSEKETLYKALTHVIESEKKIDYSAQITVREGEWRKTFVNESYEKEWNGIQKFLYRTEKKFPGSAKRIIYNVDNYRNTLK